MFRNSINLNQSKLFLSNSSENMISNKFEIERNGDSGASYWLEGSSFVKSGSGLIGKRLEKQALWYYNLPEDVKCAFRNKFLTP